MKKLKVLVLALICVLLVGCSKEKVVLTGADFISKSKEAGFTASDITSNYKFAESAYMILSDFKVIFVESKNVYDIEGIFFDECNNINKSLTENGKYEAHNGKNWSTYEATDMGDYYYVALVDNTYMYVKGKPDNKERIKEFIDTMGY